MPLFKLLIRIITLYHKLLLFIFRFSVILQCYKGKQLLMLHKIAAASTIAWHLEHLILYTIKLATMVTVEFSTSQGYAFVIRDVILWIDFECLRFCHKCKFLGTQAFYKDRHFSCIYSVAIYCCRRPL